MQSNFEKWLLSILAIVGAFFICGIGGFFLASSISVWDTPVAGFIAAFSVVSVSYLSAPVNPKVYSSSVFVLGALLAFNMLKGETYPVSFEGRAYQPTLVPYICTIIGGLIPIAFIFIPSKSAVKNS